jgi:hypothetical protein
MKKTESKLNKVMRLSAEYCQKYPESQDPFALFEIIGADELIKILEKSEGKEIDFVINYSKPFQPLFEGFSYVETVSA